MFLRKKRVNFGLLSAIFICSNALFSQSVELQSSKLFPAPLSPVELNGNGHVEFSLLEVSGVLVDAMVGDQPSLLIDVNLFNLSLKDQNTSLISGSLLEYFNPTAYDEAMNVIRFTQIRKIPANIRAEVSIPISVTHNTSSVQVENGFSARILSNGDHIDSEGSISLFTFTKINANEDSDGDGVTDEMELSSGTIPSNPCSFNVEDITLPATNSGDCDGDGVSNADEINGLDNAPGGNDATDVNDPCSFHPQSISMDVIAVTDCDGDEVNSNSDPDDQDPCNPVACVALEIPNGFTPNGDNINDAFVVEGVQPGTSIAIDIFNRWGTKVYQSTNYKNDWGGTADEGIAANGNLLPEGTYFYVLTEAKLNGEESVYKGYVFISY